MNFKGTEETDPRGIGNDQMEVAKEKKRANDNWEVVPEGWIYIALSLQAVQCSEECWTCGPDHQCSISRSNTKVCM